MNNAYINTQAAKVGRLGAQVASPLARFVRISVVALVMAGSATGALAAGQDRDNRRDEQQQAMRERFEARAQDPRIDNRAFEEVRRHEQLMREQSTREQAMREHEGRRAGRMTPDERRELKRQINEANVELYPNARRR
jgi:hypothetical protein